MPLVFIVGSWLIGHAPRSGDSYTVLYDTALPFWGAATSYLVPFLLTAPVLLICATGYANSPRVVYQMARDDQAAPVFGVIFRGNAPGPALILTFCVAIAFVMFGDVLRVLVISGTGYFFCFIVLHFGLWLQRGAQQVLWPRAALLLGVIESVIFVWGGLAWGWQDFLIGLGVPLALMGLDRALRGVPPAIFRLLGRVRSRRSSRLLDAQDTVMLHTTTLLIFFCAAALVGWLGGVLAQDNPAGPSLFVIVILLVGFLGVAAAGWTILPNIAWIRRARAETEQLLQCAADAILIADEEGVVGAANAAAEQLLSNRALIGRNIREIIALDCVTVEKDFHELAGRAELTVRQAGGVAVSVEATVSRPPRRRRLQANLHLA